MKAVLDLYCQRGDVVVALTVGNSKLPFGNRLVCDTEKFAEFFLGVSLLFSVLCYSFRQCHDGDSFSVVMIGITQNH